MKFWKIFIYRGIISLLLGIFLAMSFFVHKSYSAPLLANYFLGTLPADPISIDNLSKTDLLILSPEQAITNRVTIERIKRQNPQIILLAYVSAKSYNENWKHYPANVLYNDFRVKDEWWLRDTKGGIVSNWPGLKSVDMSEAWSNYLLDFVKTKIISQGIWDGVFWDEVYDGLSTVNGGDIDLDRDGVRDDATLLNQEWVRRTNYLLGLSRAELGVKYILTNGSSIESMQKYINGRMYENFPTPWEANGDWGAIMTRLEKIRFFNQEPRLYVFNSNTNNTGKRNNYRQMRFGLASSLLVNNIYYSFDFGDKDHAQVWWYDEYDAKLGEPVGEARSLANQPRFREGVWRRDYENGIVLLNTTGESQEVDLGGEYEKIIGAQDPKVNDGNIADKARLGARDGMIMYKMFKRVEAVAVKNGSFLRFYRADGSRARNGFFSFEEGLAGGTKIYNGDLDGDGKSEKILVTGNKLEIFNSLGARWLEDRPFGGDFKGEIRLAVGKIAGGKEVQLVVAPATGGKVLIYNYHGEIVKADWYPFGKSYRGGFSPALASFDGGKTNKIILAAVSGRSAEIGVFNSSGKLEQRFYPYGKNYRGGFTIATGDFNGDKAEEIATVQSAAAKPLVRLFTAKGKKLSEFTISGFFGSQAITLGAVEVNNEGRKELVVMSDN